MCIILRLWDTLWERGQSQIRPRLRTMQTFSFGQLDGCCIFFFEGRRRRKWSLILIFRNLTIHRNGFFSLLSFSLCLLLFIAHFYPPLAPRMYVTVNVCGRQWISLGVLCLFWLMLHFMDLIHCQICQRLCAILLNDIKSEGDYFLSFCRTNLHGEAPLQGLEGACWPPECRRTAGGGQR